MIHSNKEKPIKLVSGQACASCLYYPDCEAYAWVITRVEKKQGKGRYLVHDEFADDPKCDHFVVDSNRITPFPYVGDKLEVGDHILAVWHDDETNEYSTMLYEAIVDQTPQNDKIKIHYKGSTNIISIDVNHTTRFPPGFDLVVDPKDTKKPRGTPEDKQSPQEKRRIKFAKTGIIDPPTLPITDEDITRLGGPRIPFHVDEAHFGTPLLNFLSNPQLFSLDSPHLVTTGVIVAQRPKDTPRPSKILSGQLTNGRLAHIFNQWSQM